MDTPDLYAVLGITSQASHLDIERGYEARVRELSSHKHVNIAALEAVNEAYVVLGNEAKRTTYDTTLTPSEQDTYGRVPAVKDANLADWNGVLPGECHAPFDLGVSEPDTSRRRLILLVGIGSLVALIVSTLALRALAGDPQPEPTPSSGLHAAVEGGVPSYGLLCGEGETAGISNENKTGCELTSQEAATTWAPVYIKHGGYKNEYRHIQTKVHCQTLTDDYNRHAAAQAEQITNRALQQAHVGMAVATALAITETGCDVETPFGTTHISRY